MSNLAHSNRNNITDNSGYVKENNLERLIKLTDFSSTSIIVVTLWQKLLNTILPLSSTCFLVREFLIWMEILCNRNSMNLVQRHKKIGKDLSLLQFLQFRFSNNCKGDMQPQRGEPFHFHNTMIISSVVLSWCINTKYIIDKDWGFRKLFRVLNKNTPIRSFTAQYNAMVQ